MGKLFDALMVMGDIFDATLILEEEQKKEETEERQTAIKRLNIQLMLLAQYDPSLNTFLIKHHHLKDSEDAIRDSSSLSDPVEQMRKSKKLIALRDDNDNIKAAYLARKAACELLENEMTLAECRGEIDFITLQEILKKHASLNDLELLEFNKFAAHYFKIRNVLDISENQSFEFATNLFSFLIFLEEKIFTEDFLKVFEAQQSIVNQYKHILDFLDRAKASKKISPEDDKFIDDVQLKLSGPMQRTMRYSMTLREVQKNVNILLGNDSYPYPIAEETKMPLPKGIISELLTRLINMFEIQMSNVNMEGFLREAREKVADRMAFYQIKGTGIPFISSDSSTQSKITILQYVLNIIDDTIQKKRYTDKSFITRIDAMVIRQFPAVVARKTQGDYKLLLSFLKELFDDTAKSHQALEKRHSEIIRNGS